MAILRQCEYVYDKTKNRCHRLATKRENLKWYCKEHLREDKDLYSPCCLKSLCKLTHKKDNQYKCVQCGKVWIIKSEDLRTNKTRKGEIRYGNKK